MELDLGLVVGRDGINDIGVGEGKLNGSTIPLGITQTVSGIAFRDTDKITATLFTLTQYLSLRLSNLLESMEVYVSGQIDVIDDQLQALIDELQSTSNQLTTVSNNMNANIGLVKTSNSSVPGANRVYIWVES
jgi:hypothetical protein